MLLVCICALAVPAGIAQVATGSLGGLISDPNGASIPGAAVAAKNDATGQEFKVQTSEAGLYLFPTVGTGMYTVTVEKPGFKKLSRGNIEIRIAQRLDLNLRLEVGDVQQTITVTDSAPLLESTTDQQIVRVRFIATSVLTYKNTADHTKWLSVPRDAAEKIEPIDVQNDA